jgi:hypothetical protein
MLRILDEPPRQGRVATLVPRFAPDCSAPQTNNCFDFYLLAHPSESDLLLKPLACKSYRGESGSFLSSLSLILALFLDDSFNKS